MSPIRATGYSGFLEVAGAEVGTGATAHGALDFGSDLRLAGFVLV